MGIYLLRLTRLPVLTQTLHMMNTFNTLRRRISWLRTIAAAPGSLCLEPGEWMR